MLLMSTKKKPKSYKNMRPNERDALSLLYARSYSGKFWGELLQIIHFKNKLSWLINGV